MTVGVVTTGLLLLLVSRKCGLTLIQDVYNNKGNQVRSDLTAAFLAEMSKDASTPYQLIVMHFPVIGDVFLADRDIVVNGQLYDGLVENWGDLATVGAENAISATMTMTMTLWNGGDNPFSSYFHNEDPVNVFVDVYQTYDGLDPEDMAHIGEFVIQDPIEYDEASFLLDIELVTTNMRYFAQVGTLLTRANYPNALESDLNRSIDLIVGDAGEVSCLCSSKPPYATITGSFLALPTRVYTHESLDELNFTQNGYLQVDEEIMQYDSRTDTYFNVTVRGVQNTLATDHSDGSEIIQASNISGQYPAEVEYIVGQGPLDAITDVRVKGQIPTVPYIVLRNQDPAIIRFYAQPTFVEYSKGARQIAERFDGSTGENTALNPQHAWDEEHRTLGAVINSGHGQLAITQTTESVDDGEIIGLFLNVDHWATKTYLSDIVYVYVDGIVGHIGILNRPNADDFIDVEGSTVDIYHGHGHATGVDHTHNNVDPDFNSTSPDHLHALDATETSVDGTISQNTTKIEGSGILTRSYPYGPFISGMTRAYVRFKVITGTSKWVTYNIPSSIEIGGVTADTNNKGTVYGAWITYINNPREVVVEANIVSEGGVPGYISFQFVDIVIFSSAGATLKTPVPVSTTKSHDGVVSGLQQNTNVIKDTGDVDDLPVGSVVDLDVIAENSSRSVLQRFNISTNLETLGWDWLKDRDVSLHYVGTAESVDIIVTDIYFEVEYRQRQVKTTDEITCTAVGSIESRPDAVIQYILNTKAGVPLSNFSSVWRDFRIWDDTDVWDDNELWQDGGQVSGVPSGAAFEEAAAWFDFRNYTIDGVIPGNISVKDACQNITWQSRSRLLWQNGKVKLTIKRKTENWLIAKELELDDIQLKSFKAKRSRVDQVNNHIDLFYALDRLSAATGSERFNGTSTERDEISVQQHGEKKNDEQWLFDLVRNSSMANDLADYYIWEYGETSTFYEFNAYLNNFNLEKDDYIKMNAYRFDKVRGLAGVVRECVRRFGSGKLNKINTLQMISQVIRHKMQLLGEIDEIYVTDQINIEFGFDLDFEDGLFINDTIVIVQGKEFFDSIAIDEEFYIVMVYHSKLDDSVTIDDELTVHFDLSLESSLMLADDILVSQELCYGACGYGAVNCEIPYGSKTHFREPAVDSMALGDIINFHINTAVDDELELTDNLVASDGYGCPSIGDGLGITPYGDAACNR